MITFYRKFLILWAAFVCTATLSIRCLAACDQPMSTIEESQCALVAADLAAQKMQQSLNRVLIDAQKMNGNGSATDFQPQIRKSQSQWEEWRETQCNLEADVTMGSAGAYVLPQCRERLIVERTKSLDDIAKQLEGLL